MIKDIVVNLSVGAKHDVASDFAVSVAGMFEAHLTAVSLVYDPFVPGSLFGGTVASMVQAARAEAEQAAKRAVAKFEETARRNGLSAEFRMFDSGFANAADLFARIARRFDVSIVAQGEPDTTGPQRLMAREATRDSTGMTGAIASPASITWYG